jgi:deoxyribonuclease V
MIVAIDVDYREHVARAAGVLFRDWGDAQAAAERVVDCAVSDAYRPGVFFRRELPCIERLLREIREPLDCIVIDAYVHLGGERRPGLGMQLFDALGQRIPVIGVAKTPYRGTPEETAVFRGRSARPLYVTAAGMPEDLARKRVRAMHGDHRLPTLLQQVDRLCRRSGRCG